MRRSRSSSTSTSTRRCAAGSYALNDFDDVWGAVRHFFTAHNQETAGA